MAFQRKKVASALACVFGVGGAFLIGSPAQAADVTVQVTGSNIKRVDTETSAPIEVISRQDIDNSGLLTISAVVRQITANSNGSIADSFTNGFSASGSGVSLRGLGPNNTLVLVNGRRMATFGLADDGHASYVDLQQIPMDAVERIEVLKDGASAIYGSDAVAGVVNIILRQDFTGVTVNALAGTTSKGDGNTYRASITGGMGDLTKDKYNAYLAFDYMKQEAMPSNNRPKWVGSNNLTFMDLPDTRQGRPSLGYGTGTPYGVVRPVNPATGGLAGGGPYRPLNQSPCNPDNLIDGYCRWEIKDFIDLQPEVEKFNVFFRGQYNFNSNLTGYSELSYFDVKTHTRSTPTNVRANWYNPANNTINSSVNNFLPVGHPDNPFNAENLGARLYYSTFDVGGRDADYETSTQRYLLGLKGTNWNWDWDTGVYYIRSETDQTRYGFLQYDRLRQAYAGTSPYGYLRIGANAGLNNPAIYGWLSPSLTNNILSELTAFDAKATRDLMKLDGGQLGLAVGYEFHREELNNPGTPGTDVGNVVGLGYSAAFGSRNVNAVYAELYAPFLKNFEMSFAVRYDDYSDVGGTTNPKVGFKWTALPSFVVRGTWATAFRAPGLYETSTANATAGFVTARDPVRCPVTNSPADCSATVLDINTGNPFIKPEKSTTWTVGAIWEPITGLNGTLDYWNIETKEQITIGSVQGVLNNPAGFPAAVIGRDTNNLPGIPNSGTVLYVSTPFQNANTVKTDGIDLNIRYRQPFGQYGTGTAELQWTHIFSYTQQFASGEKFEYVGTQGNYDVSSGSATPQDRINVILGWTQGPWNVAGTIRYVSDWRSVTWADNETNGGCISTLDGPDCHVASFTTLDLAGSYTGFKNWEIYGSIINVFNRIAPFCPACAYGNINYNYNYAQSGATGTQFNLGVRYTFK